MPVFDAAVKVAACCVPLTVIAPGVSAWSFPPPSNCRRG